MDHTLSSMLVLFFLFAGNDCWIYHITPSPNNSCPEQPCLTLSEFAANTSSYFHSNTTLIFLPGNHSLSSDLIMDYMLSFQLSNIQLPWKVYITCEENSRFDMYLIHSVHISGVEFIGCGGNRIELVGNLLIEDTSFHGQDNSSTALVLVKSIATIKRSSFKSNSMGSLKLIVSYNNIMWKFNVGGAVIASYSVLTIVDSRFEGNSAVVGGAIFGEMKSNITIINSTFMNNHAVCRPSTLACYGGALYTQAAGIVRIFDSVFKNNTVTASEAYYVFNCYGGAISARGGAILYISGSEFSYNDAWTVGGAIAAWGINIRIKESTFYDNAASKEYGTGGAIYISNKKAIIDRSVFRNNQAYDGGAIWARGQRRYVRLLINESSFENNKANRSGGTLWSQQGVVRITKSELNHSMAGSFDSLGTEKFSLPFGGGAMFALQSIITINTTQFVKSETDSQGGALRAVSCSVAISKTHFNNNVAHGDGGAIHMLGIMDIDRSGFNSNKAVDGGALLINPQNYVNITLSVFNSNEAIKDGGAIFTFQGSLINIRGSEFHKNSAEHGGALYVLMTVAVKIKSNVFSSNEAKSGGGAITTYSITMDISRSTFYSNKADRGGAITLNTVKLILIRETDFRENTANNGILTSSKSRILLSDSLRFLSNIGSLFLYASNFSITEGSNISVTNNSSPHQLNNVTSNLQEGGFITAFQSNITLNGTYTVMDNNAENGGAIHATQSKVFVYGDIIIANNRATQAGGGVYLFQSELNCMLPSSFVLIGNKATEKGGGIHAISSLIQIDVDSSVNIITNNAKLGGGISLEIDAKVYILKQYNNYELKSLPLILHDNTADYGGAVYVADDTNSAMCASISHKIFSALTECSMQVLALHGGKVTSIFQSKNINFTGNHAYAFGSDLFGGLLDRCTVSPFAEIYSVDKSLITGHVNGVSYLNEISTIIGYSTISSHPIQICFCRDSEPDYNLKSLNIRVKKGELFIVSLVAVDQVNHTINATIQSSLLSNLGGLGEDQFLQNTNELCTDLSFSVFSPHDSEKLTLSVTGPCKDAELSQAEIYLHFLPCTCPIGFEPDTTELTKCTCGCDSKLLNFITECHQQSRLLVRAGNFWISPYNSTANPSDYDYDYLIYHNCPLDYCIPSTTRVYIDLNTEHGSDAQCNFNRSGTLCGRCSPGLSLSLGSSRCIECPTLWPLLCAVILTAAFLAGIALVFVLLFLNLTVATGTINGIILYANIIDANRSTFYPFKEPNFITVFIAWLNLDLGIDTCFFEEMDTYWKTLLHLAFPMYIIFLVVMVIIISERSTRFARLIGQKNPVATLATLILLSYAKLLQTIIAVLSFSILEYPDGPRDLVWLPDGTVRFLRGKHLVLFFIAVLILLAGVAYTALLFFWQWLVYYQNKKLFGWVRYQRFSLFLEPYHAPYVHKHRYWTGLLLLLRVVLYIASALNVSRAPGLELLLTGIVMVSLLLFKGSVGINGRIYRKWPVDVLETTSYMNIIFLCFATFYTLEADKDQTTVAYISGTVTFTLLLVVLAYHIFTEGCPKTCIMILNKLKMKRHHKIVNEDTAGAFSLIDYQPVDSDQRNPPQPTVSWIEAPTAEENPLEEVVDCEKQTPLLDDKEK